MTHKDTHGGACTCHCCAPTFEITLRVIVRAETISAVDDDAIGDAVISLPGVVSVEGTSPREVR